MSKKRLDYLDMAKGVGIFLVVLGHIEYLEESAMRWIYSFHMPLFFVIGGILSYVKRDSGLSFQEGVKKKASGILVPYASFSLLLLTMRVFEYFFQPERVTGRELLTQFIDAVTGYGLHILWFLPVYFLSGILFFFLCRRFEDKPYGGYGAGIAVFGFALLALGVIHSLGFELSAMQEQSFLLRIGCNVLITVLRALAILPFFLIGWLYAGTIRHGSLRKGRLFASGALLLFLGSFGALKTDILDLHYLYISPVHYVTAAMSCIGLLNLLRALPVSRTLSYLGRNSLIIMCTHGTFYVLYYVSLGMFFVRKLIPMTEAVLYGGIAVMVCVAEIPVIYIFNRYFNHLLGRKS